MFIILIHWINLRSCIIFIKKSSEKLSFYRKSSKQVFEIFQRKLSKNGERSLEICHFHMFNLCVYFTNDIYRFLRIHFHIWSVPCSCISRVIYILRFGIPSSHSLFSRICAYIATLFSHHIHRTSLFMCGVPTLITNHFHINTYYVVHVWKLPQIWAHFVGNV